jgi:ABC-type polysaccharide/polyol phosphate transport system ATPase subunit
MGAHSESAMTTTALPHGAVRFDRVTKSFSKRGGQKLLRERIVEMFTTSSANRREVLKDVSFTLAPGESLGLVGPNGSGKSTLLNLATGLCDPDSGEIEIGGRVGALLELAAAVHPDLTGAENLRIHAALMGLSRQETARNFESIVDFSGIREFMQQSVRTYSSGMIMRLGFAVAASVAPDVLLIDEIIGVGDRAFQERAHDRVQELRRAGHTILLASHSEPLITSLCDRALWLDHGHVRMLGEVDEVFAAYREAVG